MIICHLFSPFVSGVQSSGTDHEASIDCATTSHIHSTGEYNQDTTGGKF